MQRYQIHFASRALPGQDEAFNRWYDQTHIPLVLKVEGFLSCQRYRVVADEPQPRYISVYEIESDDPKATLGKLYAASQGQPAPPSLDMQHVSVTILAPYKALG